MYITGKKDCSIFAFCSSTLMNADVYPPDIELMVKRRKVHGLPTVLALAMRENGETPFLYLRDHHDLNYPADSCKLSCQKAHVLLSRRL